MSDFVNVRFVFARPPPTHLMARCASMKSLVLAVCCLAMASAFNFPALV